MHVSGTATEVEESTCRRSNLRIPDVLWVPTQPHEELASVPAERGTPKDVSMEEHVLVTTNADIEDASSQPPESQGAPRQEQRVVEQGHSVEARETKSLASDEQPDIGPGRGGADENNSTSHYRLTLKNEYLGSNVSLNRRTIAEEAEKLLQEERVARERADALAQLQNAGPTEDRPQPPKQDKVRKLWMRNRLTHQDISWAGTWDAAIADELWNGDEGYGTTAGAAGHGPSQQDTERYSADLPNPERAQRVAIGKQETEELLGDTPSREVQEKPTRADIRSGPPPGRRVTITIHASDTENWRRTDTVFVSSDNPHETQSIADHHAQARATLRDAMIGRYGSRP
ncbi:hypothetical protein CNMCM8980_005997 [Aspergillus fumigatiaffinis]|nr:hypothetical protein CNMCM8980_005997 [Aspergillus fumigatiaffinis]